MICGRGRRKSLHHDNRRHTTLSTDDTMQQALALPLTASTTSLAAKPRRNSTNKTNNWRDRANNNKHDINQRQNESRRRKEQLTQAPMIRRNKQVRNITQGNNTSMTHTHTHTHIHARADTHTCRRIYIYQYTQTCTHTYIYIYT